MGRSSIVQFICCLAIAILLGCDRHPPASAPAEVILYTSIDEPVAKPIIEAFQKQTGISVNVRYDTEATRSVALAERLAAEKGRPQADVWWSNEIFHTINLAKRGVLAAYQSPSANSIPTQFKDPQHRWTGNGLRLRVLAASTRPGTPKLESLQDLLKPELKGHIVMARPSAGTTAGHMAALYALWGEDRYQTFCRGLRDNQVALVGGNSVVVEKVGGPGQISAGLTDNDDVQSMIHEGGKLLAVIPDQAEGQLGTLAIPTTVALVSGAPHAQPAQKLVDYLLSPQVEQNLLSAQFAAYSVRNPAQMPRLMAVDYTQAAENLNQAVNLALQIIEGR